MSKTHKTTALIITAASLVIIIAFTGLFIYLAKNMKPIERETCTEISKYGELLGQGGEFRDKFTGECIFPDELPESAKTENFYTEYYNPYNPNYLGFLVYTCNAEDYLAECNRLLDMDSTAEDDWKIYGINKFPYELLAVFADKAQGVTYAMCDDENNRLIYFALSFTNYYTDIEYKDAVNGIYLPVGFDASPGNASYKEYRRN